MEATQKELTYKIVEKEIRSRITSGKYVLGQQLPPERELERELGVSRLTIAKGLSNLASEGFITRTRGRGSFVCPKLPRTQSRKQGIIKYISPDGGHGRNVISHGILEGLHSMIPSSSAHVCVDFYSTVEEQIDILQHYTDSINDGFVIWPALDKRIVEILAKMQKDNFPFVLVDAFFPEFGCDYVVSDNYIGAENMVNFLVSSGHHDICYFTACPDRTSLSELLSGVVSSLSKNNIAVSSDTINIIPGGDAVASSYKSAQNAPYLCSRLEKIFKNSEGPSAILASNDWIAMAIHDILARNGIKVPDDVSLASFDNIDASQYFVVPLTTMGMDFYEMGRRAAKILFSRKEGSAPGGMFIQNRVSPKLVPRDSIKKIKF